MNYVYIDVPEPYKSEIINYRENNIKAQDTIGEYPFDPHITIKWGLKTDDVKEIADTVGNFIPIRVMFGATKMFMWDDYRDYDVLKVDVFGMSLVRMNRVLNTLPHKDVYKTYNPHMTINYLQPRMAMHYIGNNPWIGKKFVVDTIKFRTHDEKEYSISCDGTIK